MLIIIFSYASFIANKITNNSLYEFLKLSIILINSIIIFSSNPRESVNPSNLTDIYFISYYTIDITLKIIARGIILNENSYLKNNWNVFEMLILIVAYLEKFMRKYKYIYNNTTNNTIFLI